MIEYPVDFKVSANAMTLMDFLPGTDAIDLTTLGIREWLGIGFYWLKYRT